MTGFKSDFLNTLSERGFIYQGSDMEGLDKVALAGGLTGYIGYDATAASLHVGHLLQIMMLRWMQKTGGRPIALMGGGTTRIGDPSFRDDQRPLLDEAGIARNLEGIKGVFAKYLDFDGPARMVNNADWLDKLQYIDFLRDYGRHFSVNRMLSFESVKQRLDRDQSLSFLEFNYMILQAYDFVELYRRFGCRVQMGGSDQWGNIVNGIELTRRTADGEVFALTSPLLTTSSGAKMGKTAGGAVWLNADMKSPYEFWQYWRNTEDGDVERFLKLFTELPMDEIARLAALGGSEINDAKKVLATEVTALCHGRALAEEAQETARTTFEEGALAHNLPTITVAGHELSEGLGILTALVRAGLATSNGEARRHIQGGAVRINDQPVADDKASIGDGDLAGGVVKLSVGRKKHVLVRPDHS